MKFSLLEQNVISDLCSWAQSASTFCPIRSFFRSKALHKGTGLFTFSNEIENRPPTILCVSIQLIEVGEYEEICNNVIFVLHFLRKLESLGLVTISEGRYDEDKEYVVAAFADFDVTTFRKTSDNPWNYSFGLLERGKNVRNLELIQNGLTIRDEATKVALPYHTMEIFSRIDSFKLLSSNIALDQGLFDLIENGFKTTEELMLDTASRQLRTSNLLLSEAQIQTKKSTEYIEQTKIQFETSQSNAQRQFEYAQAMAKERFESAQTSARDQFEIAQNNLRVQFETAQNNARDQFNTEQKNAQQQFLNAQNESIRQFESANCKSKLALFFAVVSIIMSPYVAKYIPSTLDNTQYQSIDSMQVELHNTLQNLRKDVSTLIEIERRDSSQVEVIEKMNEISITLKHVNDRLNRSPLKQEK